jgi:hypothetical protein
MNILATESAFQAIAARCRYYMAQACQRRQPFTLQLLACCAARSFLFSSEWGGQIPIKNFVSDEVGSQVTANQRLREIKYFFAMKIRIRKLSDMV